MLDKKVNIKKPSKTEIFQNCKYLQLVTFTKNNIMQGQ